MGWVVGLGMRRCFAGVADGGFVVGIGGVALRWRGCFAGVAGESLFVRATKSNQKARRCRWPSIPRRQWFERLWTPAMVVGRSTLLRHVSQNLCLARYGVWTIPKTDSGTAFQSDQWWDAFGCAARASSSGGKRINVADVRGSFFCSTRMHARASSPRRGLPWACVLRLGPCAQRSRRRSHDIARSRVHRRLQGSFNQRCNSDHGRAPRGRQRKSTLKPIPVQHPWHTTIKIRPFGATKTRFWLLLSLGQK
ncbi:hypothetical protein LMG26411_05206 [Cupriavidus numazuensis]|uniref:Transposase n=1 Tax=Cupriavidus numazuensis TaxID=221992 RepID=A0ABM8TNP4_9BURK|nr:hypothetical protein LMG26411_05206 [Cupriavidus numazuensis]